MKCVETRLEGHWSLGGVKLKLRIVHKVNDGTSNLEHTFRYVLCIHKESNKEFLHFFVFGTDPLRYQQNSLLEMVKTRESVHSLESSVNFFLANHAGTPLDQMVLEGTLV